MIGIADLDLAVLEGRREKVVPARIGQFRKPELMQNRAGWLANQFAGFPAGEPAGSRVDESDAAMEIEPENAFTHRVKQQFVAPVDPAYLLFGALARRHVRAHANEVHQLFLAGQNGGEREAEPIAVALFVRAGHFDTEVALGR